LPGCAAAEELVTLLLLLGRFGRAAYTLEPGIQLRCEFLLTASWLLGVVLFMMDVERTWFGAANSGGGWSVRTQA
jgi:hypothetical protein